MRNSSFLQLIIISAVHRLLVESFPLNIRRNDISSRCLRVYSNNDDDDGMLGGMGDVESGGSMSDDNDNDDIDPVVIRPKRMIDLSDLGRYSEDEASALNSNIREEVSKSFDKSIENIEKMKERLKAQGDASLEAMRKSSDERLAQQIAKTDSLVDSFLEKTKADREGTKMAAAADSRMQGKGLSAGVWGVDEFGRAVVTNNSEGTFSSPKSGLTSRGIALRSSGDTTSGPGTNAKVLFVTPDKASDLVKELTSRLESMLSDGGDFGIDVVTSPAKEARIGGNDAATCIIFPGAADEPTKMNQLVDRIRTPTASTINGPPSHFIYIDNLGTSRSNEFPYSLQNMLGQLDKILAAEESLKSTCTVETSSADQQAADYTIIKIGKLAKDSSKIKRDEKNLKAALNGNTNVALSPGDSLNGDISVDDAADVIYQSILLQSAARNSTFSAVSFPSEGQSTNQQQWDDLFVKLVGPELIRLEVPEEQDYGELCAFMEEWARLFETSPTSKTGLTTPVTVSRSPALPNAVGVEIKFKTTATGDLYKTAKEDKREEKMRQNYPKSTPSRKTEIKTKKPRKDGGVEILVEQYPSLRIRARRCNMDDKTVVKEMSEKVILKKLEQDLNFYLNRK